MIRHSRFSFHWMIPAALALSLGAVYAATLAPGLSWANNGADGGDFISAVATGGVPHPTGYPTYLLLAGVLRSIPLGSLAFRMNLFSAACMLVAALLVYAAVVRFLSTRRLNWLAGAIAALAFGLSPLVWSQAVITEVYGLQTLFGAIILYLWAYGITLDPGRLILYDITAGLLAGLALGNHLTSLFLLPVVFSMGGAIKKVDHETARGLKDLFLGWKINWAALARRFGALLAGLLVYLALPLRAMTNPPVNWGDPVTLNTFLALVSGRLYSGLVFTLPWDYILPRIQYWAHLLSDQFGWLGLAVLVYGLLFNPTHALKNIAPGLAWLFIVYSVFSIGYNSYDSDVYLIPAFLVAAIWLGLGALELVEWAGRRAPKLGIIMGSVVLIGLIVPAVLHYPQVDASHDNRAAGFGQAVFASAPARAIVFTQGDQATFALRYFQYVLHQRADVALVVADLMPYDWYRLGLAVTYPALHVPGQAAPDWSGALIQANPGRPVCLVSYLQASEISCH
jgi:hypothetical protein